MNPKPNPTRARKPGSQSGLSLIEVLIALVVLSIGLVGMASLHLNSLKNAHSSYYRSIASTMALDYEERLWQEVSDLNLNGCPNPEPVRAALSADWQRSSSELAGAPLTRIPNVIVTIEDTRNGANGQWREVDLRLVWREDRFRGEEELGDEQFDYTVRVLCRPSV